MTPDDLDDPMLRQLRHLPVAEPDAARSARLRARCRARLARRQPRAGREPLPPVRRLAVERLLAASFSAGYLIALIRDVVGVHSLR